MQLRQKLINNSFFISILFFCFSIMLIYLSESTSNVPIMDYWRYLDALVEKMYNGGVSFSDLYSNNGIHRTPAQLFLFLVNVSVFHWNTQISVYFGAFILCITACVLYKIIKGSFAKKGLGYYVCTVSIILAVFTLGAQEILILEFSTSFALRILTFVLGFYFTDNILHSIEKYTATVWYLALYYIFVICIMGAAYGMGFAISIILLLLLDFLRRDKISRKIYFREYLILTTGVMLGVMLYVFGLDILASVGGEMSSGIFNTMWLFVKGLLIVCGASVIGSELSANILIACGIIVLLVHVICLGIYVKRRMFEITYIPAYLYIYFITFVAMIFTGRGGYGVEYLSSSRYVCDAVMGVIADIIVLSMLINTKYDSVSSKTKKVSVLIVILLCMGILCADIKEMRIAKYRKIYQDNLIQTMLNIEEYGDEDLTSFQANNPDQVRRGIEIMKKYNLGVFHNSDIE